MILLTLPGAQTGAGRDSLWTMPSTVASTVFLGLALVLASQCGDRQAAGVTFVIAVRDLPKGVRDQAIADGHGPADTLRFARPGERFDPPVELRPIPPDSVDRSTPLGAEAAAFSAFKAADPDWMVQTFAETDHSEIRSFLADSAVRAGSQRLFASLERVWVYAIVRHQVGAVDYRLALFTYRDSPRRGNVHVYVQERGEWKRTNRLARDLDVTLVHAAFREGRLETR